MSRLARPRARGLAFRRINGPGLVMNTIDLASLLFTFDGRINRAKYWIAFAIYCGVMLIAVGLIFALPGMIGIIMIGIIYIAAIVSGIAVGIKRLHDCDKSGWWLLLFYVAPGILSTAATNMDAPMIVNLASLAVSIWGIVQLGFLRGTIGANRFGPDPIPGAATA
ncbi:DUF805 domain-containing protein [Pseudolabrys taiwanensis]|uniref:DUF805 domain-containing protein n=2 Tax=Pseudolabrys taiwanensis TaxID=331696 RepID=A0A345ZW42_9HYPH|nr:DUF805 domain-containing protein [Pseudolabrys taiwanensis]